MTALDGPWAAGLDFNLYFTQILVNVYQLIPTRVRNREVLQGSCNRKVFWKVFCDLLFELCNIIRIT